MSVLNERLRRWNERYASGDETYAFNPSPPLPEAIRDVAPGLALDLACGAGRHALHLAERGWRVTAVDGASAGIDRLLVEARRRGVADAIDARVADLMCRPREFRIEPARYDLICDFYFLDRTLFDEIRDGVRSGGLFIGAIHVAAEAGVPHERLLEPGELRGIVEGWGWEVLSYAEGGSSEGGHAHGTATVVARAP